MKREDDDKEISIKLTEGQKERIRRNRQIAMERREAKRLRLQCASGVSNKLSEAKFGGKNVPAAGEANEGDGVGVSVYVTKQEAMHSYCLPQGTLDVCEFTERENPRNRKFQPMKLFHRAEVRRRAYERYGGKDGLEKERERRKRKRFEKDMANVREIFESG